MNRLLPVAALAALLPAVIVAGSTSLQQSSQSPPVFRAQVNHIAVDVIVDDAHGHPVAGLTKDDFAIQDRGKNQRIEDFAEVTVPAVSRATDTHRIPTSDDVADNRVPAPSSRVFAILIDDASIHLGDTVKAKRFLMAFLRDLQPADRVAFVFVHRSDLALNFTEDMASQVRAIERLDTAIGWGPDAPASRLTLEHAIAVLSTIPATKRVIVYVSSGFQTVPVQTLDLISPKGVVVRDVMTIGALQQLIDHASAANVTMYAVDPRGLLAPELNLAARLEDQTPENRAALDVSNRNDQDTLRVLPGNMRGLSFVNTSDFDGAAKAIAADSGHYYLLGYAPVPDDHDGRFHKIEVSLPGRPDLRVRARPGYVAEDPASVGSIDQRLAAAMADAEPQTNLQLRVFAAPVRFTASAASVAVSIEVDYPKDVEGSSLATDTLSLAFTAADPDGKVLRAVPHQFSVSKPEGQGIPRHVVIDDVMDVPHGRWTLTVGVASRSLGAVGTTRLSVETESKKGLQVSPIILGLSNPRDPPSMVINRDGLAALMPFQPTLDREFATTSTVSFFVRSIGAGKVPVTITLHSEDDPAFSRVVAADFTPSTRAVGAFDLVGALDLRGLEAGRYVLVVSPKGGRDRSVDRAVPFDVR